MSHSTPLPLSVCWHEGMLLSPQHFQQNHIFWERQLQSVVHNASPYRWGLIHMEIDKARLLEGEVYFNQLQAIMPDGLQVDINESDEEQQLQLDLSESETLKEQGKVKVQLTVPIRVPGSASNSSQIQRFLVVDSDPVKDDNTGEGEKELQRLKPILSLQAKENVSKQYIALPLFEVELEDGARYQVSHYCPPILGIGADNFMEMTGRQSQTDDDATRQGLQRRLQAVAFAIRKKARQLAGFSEEGDEQFGNRVTEQHRLWIRAMVQHLAEFELLADNGFTSPWQIYQVLARLIGSMCELDARHVPPKLPPYQHLDCAASLDEALDYVNRQLDKVNLRYTTLVLEEGQNGVFTINFDKAWDGQDLLIELKPRPGQTQSELVEWLDDCRIASAKLHKELATKRILGAVAEQIADDGSTEVSLQPGHTLFCIKFDAAVIKLGQPLAIVCANGKIKHQQPKRIVLHLPHDPPGKQD